MTEDGGAHEGHPMTGVGWKKGADEKDRGMDGELFIVNQQGEITFQGIDGLTPNASDCKPFEFSKEVKRLKGLDPPPLWASTKNLHHHIKRNGLYWVYATRKSDHDTSAFVVTELLESFHRLCAQFCGDVSEDTLLKNPVLLLEVSLEIMNGNFIQLTSPERVKLHLYATPVVTRDQGCPPEQSPFANPKVAPSTAANKSVLHRPAADEEAIFVDVIEKVSAVVGADGGREECKVTGIVRVSYHMRHANDVMLMLSKNVALLEPGKVMDPGMISIYNWTLHGNATLADKGRLRLVPTLGQSTVLKYSFPDPRLPVTLSHAVHKKSKDADVELTIRLDIPWTLVAPFISVRMCVPPSTSAMMQSLDGSCQQSAELLKKDSTVTWSLKGMHGNTSATARFKLVDASGNVGPATIQFEVPISTSGLQVDSIQGVAQGMKKWVRHVTLTDSYTCRFT